jgi:hypothetical protein
MKKKSNSRSAFFNLRVLLGVSVGFLGVALGIFAVRPSAEQRAPAALRYMPVPADNPQEEAAGLSRLEQFWFDRLTFPTGRFNPAWVRAAAAQHDRMQSGVPFGQHLKLNLASPNALSTTSFTALGPSPERMTGCSGCFNYTTAESGKRPIVAAAPPHGT